MSIPEDYAAIIAAELNKDESKRDRLKLIYASDILLNHKCWPQPNSIVSKIIHEEIDYRDLPVEENNEGKKRCFLPEQAKFVAQYAGELIMCEVLGTQCSTHDCPLYIPASQMGNLACQEYKIMFNKYKRIGLEPTFRKKTKLRIGARYGINTT